MSQQLSSYVPIYTLQPGWWSKNLVQSPSAPNNLTHFNIFTQQHVYLSYIYTKLCVYIYQILTGGGWLSKSISG